MKKHLAVIVCVLALLGVIFVIGRQTSHAPAKSTHNETQTAKQSKSIPKTPSKTQETLNKTQYSLSDPTSIWLVVNKQRPLDPKTYTPTSLVVPSIPLRSNITSTEKYVRSDMATPLQAMVTAAKKEGITLNLQSGYRSYAFQVSLYNSYVKQEGQAKADTESARPGYSEHQTGLAADLGGITQPGCNVAGCFADTVEGKWLAANAYKYGFIVRYPEGKQATTGYVHEPWHVRYVGQALAEEMKKQDIKTLEEFFSLPPAPDYK